MQDSKLLQQSIMLLRAVTGLQLAFASSLISKTSCCVLPTKGVCACAFYLGCG